MNHQKNCLLFIVGMLLSCCSPWPLYAAPQADQPAPDSKVGEIISHSEGLHGYISFQHEPLPESGEYTAGMGFYSAVWPLTDKPLADFQIGLPSAWIQPNNSDNKDQPLAPEGTLARTWKERGPTGIRSFKPLKVDLVTGLETTSGMGRQNSA